MSDITTRRSYSNIIKFGFSPHRKNIEKSNFDSKLNPYWQRQYDDMFKNW